MDLVFGQRRVIVPVSCHTSVEDLYSTAGAIATLEPASLLLTCDGVALRPGTNLGTLTQGDGTRASCKLWFPQFQGDLRLITNDFGDVRCWFR